MLNTVSFPGLGIGEFTVNPSAITIGGFSIQWYAIIICIGILTAFVYCERKANFFGLNDNDFLDLVLFSIPIAFIGARIVYILGDLDSFDTFWDMIYIRNGGLSIYGGIIFAAITVFCVCKFKKIDSRNAFDVMGMGMLIGQAIGRWGNFFNIEVYGVETNLPWRMGIGYDCVSQYVHPLFLYESLWNIIGFCVILAFLENRKFKGEVFLWYISWYSLGRAVLEPMRNTQFNLELFGIKLSLAISILLFIISTALIIYFRIKIKTPQIDGVIIPERKKKEVKYESQFESELTDDAGIGEDEYTMKKLYDKLDENAGEEDKDSGGKDN